MTKAEQILQRLNSVARQLLREGYGTAKLTFSDGAVVSRTDWAPGPLEEIEQLLQAGEMPLGFIAPLREGQGEPFIEAWDELNPTAVGELRKSALLYFGHRLAAAFKWPESPRGKQERSFGDIDVV